jgi:hypothetical protein
VRSPLLPLAAVAVALTACGKGPESANVHDAGSTTPPVDASTPLDATAEADVSAPPSDAAPEAAPIDAGPPCNVVDVNGNGPDDDDIQALLCAGRDAILCASTTYAVDGLDDGGTCGPGLHFVAQGQKLHTEGYPTGASRAILREGQPDASTVLAGNGIDGVSLTNVEIDGSRPTLNSLKNGDALVSLTGLNVEVGFAYLHDTRGWSTLHIVEGNGLRCSGAYVHDNTLGPAGCDKQGSGCTASDPSYAKTGDGTWADGLSLSCKNAVVTNNTITDATDGAIVLFGAPGSHVFGNHVFAKTRHLFGAINMVDIGPYAFDAGGYSGGDYTGDEVNDNDLHAAGARIDVGIAQGPQVWSSWCGSALMNRGGYVHDNTADGADFGYGFVVDGVTGWKEQANTSTATHSGVGNGCGGQPAPPAAAALLYHGAHTVGSTVQGSDVATGIHNALE